MGGIRVAAGAAVVVLGLAAPAHADPVVVQGTSFPDPARTNLSLVGCGDLYQRAPETLRPTVSRGPGAAPLGERSLGFDLDGGNAAGALFTVGSVLSTTTASLAVNAVGPARGVAYAGYQEPADAGTSLLWLGRSELATPGGAWQTVEATTRDYTWAKYDMATHQQVSAPSSPPATVAAFAAAHGGDGPGVFTIGFGCDGTPFSVDALRVGGAAGATTYDLEGLRTTVGIEADRLRVDAGEPVTLRGVLTTGTGDPVPHATVLLEQRADDGGAWEPVAVVPVGPGGVARFEVRPEAGTAYRWRFVDRPLAEASTSLPLVLDVVAPVEPTPTPTPKPTPRPTPRPTPTPTPTSSDTPSPAPPASEPPSAEPTPEATPEPAPTSVVPTLTDESPTSGRSTRHGHR